MKIELPVVLRKLIDRDYSLIQAEFDEAYYLESCSDLQLQGEVP